ncbi:MAG: hypothetical protein M1818_002809 [Claussenomyces sp. TS43310]|nr:MAG: hypothetical protein M1818_002809 [Claussenomyces sp. TS43310]
MTKQISDFDDPRVNISKECVNDQGVTINHGLELIKLRDDGYNDRCKSMYGNPAPKAAVDHIIELWEVKRAYYRAVRLLEGFNTGESWYITLNEPQILLSDHSGTDLKNKLYKPTQEWQRLEVLANLRFIFNSSGNLCLIDSKFNLDKNKFLDKARPVDLTDDAIEKTRCKLQAYYIATQELMDHTLGEVLKLFHVSGNVLYFVIWFLLHRNYVDFVAECGQGQPIKGQELLPLHTFLPFSIMTEEETFKVVSDGVNTLMNLVPEAEWEEREAGYAMSKASKKASK